MMNMALLAGGALALAALAGAAQAAETQASGESGTSRGFLFQEWKQGDTTYKYAVYVPRNYTPDKAWPLIMFLHGAGESGTDGAKQIVQGIGSAMLWNIEAWPFIVLFPQKPDVPSQWEQHDAFVMGILDKARKDYKVDGSRLYLTGLSQGGHGTWVLGSRHADVWAAMAPICGYGAMLWNRENQPKTVFTGEPSELAGPLKKMPIWAFHGEADPVVPVKATQDLVEAVRAVGGAPKLTTYPGVDHNSWDKAYREEKLFDWFLSHKK